MKKRILFLCTANSCRSQIAEGFAQHFHSDKYDVYSAGIELKNVNPRAIKVMREIGIDISAQTSNSVQEYADMHFDLIITVCDNAKTQCPIFHNAKGEPAQILNWSIEDPAEATGSEEEILNFFRQIRDKIKEKIEKEI